MNPENNNFRNFLPDNLENATKVVKDNWSREKIEGGQCSQGYVLNMRYLDEMSKIEMSTEQKESFLAKFLEELNDVNRYDNKGLTADEKEGIKSRAEYIFANK